MGYNTQGLLEDIQNKPIPQEYNPLIDKFEPLQGHGGASSMMKARWWQIGTAPAATTTVIPTLSLSGLTVSLSTATQAQWVGSRFGINIGGTLCEGVVTGVTSSGTITLDSPLPSAPAAGAKFYLIPPDQSSLVGSNVIQATFQNAVAVSGNGTAVSAKGFKTLVVEVFGATSPAGTVSFQAASVSGIYAPITGTNLNGLAQATSTSAISATPTQWQFDVEGLDSFECPVTWTAGTITVQGRLQA